MLTELSFTDVLPYFKDSGAIFQKPQNSIFFNSVQILLNYTIIYGQFINNIQNHMDVLVLELDGLT